MNRRYFQQLCALAAFVGASLLAGPALAADEAAEGLIKRLSTEVLDSIRADKAIQAGDVNRIIALVDSKIMPNVNFQRMTASAVGPGWRQATPEQQKQLMVEFRALLLRTYAGALTAVSDQQVRVKPLRAAPEDTEVVVRTEIVQARGEPIQLDYRLEKKGDSWRIFNLNIAGVWLVETYRNQFTQEISAKGMDGLIQSLAERNRKFAQAAKAS